MKAVFRIFAACILASLMSCSVLKSIGKKQKPVEKPKKTEVQAPKLIGRVASISPDRKFVLIQSYGQWEVPTGSILTTLGEQNRTANLLATGESLGQFAAADIQSGNVETGDGAYFRPPVKTPESTPTDTPGQPIETPKPAESEKPSEGNVQKNN